MQKENKQTKQLQTQKQRPVKDQKVLQSRIQLQNNDLKEMVAEFEKDLLNTPQPEQINEKVALQQENLLLKKEITLLKNTIRQINLQTINENYKQMSTKKGGELSFFESQKFSDSHFSLNCQQLYDQIFSPTDTQIQVAGQDVLNYNEDNANDMKPIQSSNKNDFPINSRRTRSTESNSKLKNDYNSTRKSNLQTLSQNFHTFTQSSIEETDSLEQNNPLQQSKSCLDLNSIIDFEAFDILNNLVPTSKEIDNLIIEQEKKIISLNRIPVTNKSKESSQSNHYQNQQDNNEYANQEQTMKKPLTPLSASKNTPDFNNSISNDTLRQNLFLSSPAMDSLHDIMHNRRDSYKFSQYTNPTERHSQKSLKLFDAKIVEEDFYKKQQIKKPNHSNIMDYQKHNNLPLNEYSNEKTVRDSRSQSNKHSGQKPKQLKNKNNIIVVEDKEECEFENRRSLSSLSQQNSRHNLKNNIQIQMKKPETSKNSHFVSIASNYSKEDYNWLCVNNKIDQSRSQTQLKGKNKSQVIAKNYQSPYSLKAIRSSQSKTRIQQNENSHSQATPNSQVKSVKSVKSTTRNRSHSKSKQNRSISISEFNKVRSQSTEKQQKSQQFEIESTKHKMRNYAVNDINLNTQFTIDHSSITLSRELPLQMVDKSFKDHINNLEKQFNSLPKNQFDQTQNRFILGECLAEAKRDLNQIISLESMESSRHFNKQEFFQSQPSTTIEQQQIPPQPANNKIQQKATKHRKSASLLTNISANQKPRNSNHQSLTKQKIKLFKHNDSSSITQSLLQPVLKSKGHSRKSSQVIEQNVYRMQSPQVMDTIQFTEKTFEFNLNQNQQIKTIPTNVTPRCDQFMPQMNSIQTISSHSKSTNNVRNKSSKTRSKLMKPEDQLRRNFILNKYDDTKNYNLRNQAVSNKHCKNCIQLQSKGLPLYLCKQNHN